MTWYPKKAGTLHIGTPENALQRMNTCILGQVLKEEERKHYTDIKDCLGEAE